MTTLKKIILIILFPIILVAQQESKVTVGGSSKNEIEVTQKGKDTLQKSDLQVTDSDSNKIKINQELIGKTETKESSGFKFWNENIGLLFGTLISIATFIGLAWKGFQHLKNKKK